MYTLLSLHGSQAHTANTSISQTTPSAPLLHGLVLRCSPGWPKKTTVLPTFADYKSEPHPAGWRILRAILQFPFLYRNGRPPLPRQGQVPGAYCHIWVSALLQRTELPEGV